MKLILINFFSVEAALKEHEDDLVSMLVLLKHTWSNAALLVQLLANSLVACCAILRSNTNTFDDPICMLHYLY